jgi:ElaA protein
MQAQIHWQCLSFEQLTTKQLYTILGLRSQVFVVEQDCVYQDIDGADPQALHVCGWDGEQLVAYARLFAPGVKFAEAALGRVISNPACRGSGAGRQLLQQCLSYLSQHYGNQAVRISAQSYLCAFYQSFGFAVVSDEYLEDDIPHLEMLRAAA